MSKNKKIDPWEAFPKIWRNDTAFFTYLRGCLRKAWSKSPVKHSVLKANRKQIPNPNPNGKKSTVFGFECAMCHKDFPMAACQVDHITPAGSLNKKEDIQGFVERLLWVTDEDLRLVCKGCNSALAYADRNGISYEDAVLEKRVIELCKLTTKQQQKILDKYNLPSNNQKIRREGLTQLLKDGIIE